MLWSQLQDQAVTLGLDFYLPAFMPVVLCALVPVWVSIGSAAILMLVMSEALPISS